MSQYPRFVSFPPVGVWETCIHGPNFQGFDGPVTFAGFTPDLDEFTIRIEDGPGNVYVDEASRVNDGFGRTNFAGYRVDQGDIWQAKSDFEIDCSVHSTLTSDPEYIMDEVFARTSVILEPFRSQDYKGKVPNPAFTLQVSNSIQPGSNLYAVQKAFKGPFQFDVFYESASANHKLDGTVPPLLASLVTLTSTPQRRAWIRGSQL
jgi:mannosyl-oligosaccharide glucosidase